MQLATKMTFLRNKKMLNDVKKNNKITTQISR